jgi:hypothetical protein
LLSEYSNMTHISVNVRLCVRLVVMVTISSWVVSLQSRRPPQNSPDSDYENATILEQLEVVKFKMDLD